MRKFLIALLSIVCVLFCSLGLIACGEETNDPKEPSGNDPEVVNSIFNEVKSEYLLGENYTFSEDDIEATGKTDSVVSFNRSVALDLGGNTLDMNGYTLKVNSSENDALVVIKNGTVKNGNLNIEVPNGDIKFSDLTISDDVKYELTAKDETITILNAKVEGEGKIKSDTNVVIDGSTVGEIKLDGKVKLSATNGTKVKSVSVSENAKDSKIDFDATVVVDSLKVEAKIEIKVSGVVNSLVVEETAQDSEIKIDKEAYVSTFVAKANVAVEAEKEINVIVTAEIKIEGDNVKTEVKTEVEIEEKINESQEHVKRVVKQTPATCTSDGEIELECSCGKEEHKEKVVLKKLGHSFTNYVSDNNATCESDGTKTAKCDRCDATDKITDEGTKLGHSYSDDWSYDESYHWHSATCEHIDERKDYAEHIFDGKICSVCGYEATIVYSQGLAYTLINNDTEYKVSGISTCKDTDIVIPSTYNGKPVTSIGDSAFYNCRLLTSVTIPDSVTSIEKYAFYYCSSLTSIEIPDGVTSIGFGAFYYCRSLTSVTIGNSVKSIGEGAFCECSSLTSVTIGNSVTSIGGSAFAKCSSLTSVTIPNSVESIGESAFIYCSSLTSITVEENNQNYKSIDGNLYSKDGKTLIQYAIGKTDSTFVIPDSVESIGRSAFRSCSSLMSVTIGNSVKSIGDYAFSSCSSLTSVTIGNSVTSIGDYAFDDCDSLISVTIPDSVTSIGDMAFYGCYKLVEVINRSNLKIEKGSTSNGYVGYYALKIKTSGESEVVNKDGYLFYTVDNVNYLFGYTGAETDLILPSDYNGEKYEINKYAFYDNDKTTSVAIPDSVTSIGREAFFDCDSLTSITIGNSVTSIGEDAFYGCDSLTSVTIGNSVTSIGEKAFYWCDSLTSVTIGNGVTSIGNYAFAYCDSLSKVYYKGTLEDWDKISIGGNNSPLIYATKYYYSEVKPQTTGNYWHYDADGKTVLEW